MPWNEDGSRKTALYKKSSGFKMKEFSGFGNSPLMDKKPHTGLKPPHRADHGSKKPTVSEDIKDWANKLTFGLVEKVFPTSTTSTPTTPTIPPKASKLKETPGYADVTPFKPISLPPKKTEKVGVRKIKTKKTKKKKDNKPEQYLRDFTK